MPVPRETERASARARSTLFGSTEIAVLHDLRNRVRSALDSQLLEDPLEVPLNRVLGEFELTGDVGVATTADHTSENISLARSQLILTADLTNPVATLGIREQDDGRGTMS